MQPSLHPDATAILARLKQEGITALYHFTSVENLPSICQMGALHSKHILEKQGLLSALITGGNSLSHSLDRYHGNWDKVSLNFTPYTPMAYHRKRAQHLCIFLINPEVATWSEVLFTDSNAARSDHRRGEGLIGLGNVQFNAIHAIPFSVNDWHRFVQAEVLIPTSIPLAHVSEIGFVSNASMNYSQHLCKSFAHPPFSVKAQMFTDSPRAPQTAINFAYVKEFLLTDPKAGPNMVYLEKNKYSMTVDDYVKVIVDVNALAGTEGRLSLRSISSGGEDVIRVKEFLRQDEHRHTCNIPLNKLLVGSYLVKYLLRGVCWSISSFEVVP